MDVVQSGFRALIRHEVRAHLRGVWLRGELPAGGAVLAVNHHSWWDGYVLAELAWSFGQPAGLLMNEAQLSRFSFFRRLGVLGTRELRPALRRLRQGEWLFVFPEGELLPAGPPRSLHPGAAWLARAANVPLVPVALRVALRGHQHPEAYLRAGPPTSELAGDLGELLATLDRELRLADAESPLPGYLRLVRGARSSSERGAFLGEALGRLLRARA